MYTIIKYLYQTWLIRKIFNSQHTTGILLFTSHLMDTGNTINNWLLSKSLLEILDTIEYIDIKEIFKNESNVH